MLQNLKIDLITSFNRSDEVLNRLSKATVFGLDCEWDIVQEKGAQQKPDLLQIATPDGYCALFRLNLLKTVPRGLQNILENPYCVKVGVGITEDTKKLLESYGVQTRSAVDIRYIADVMGYDPRGLSHLSECILGIPCKKYSYSSHFHNWSGYLTGKQLRYAAEDAAIAVSIFNKLRLEWACHRWGDKCKEWDDSSYHKNTEGLWRKYVGRDFNYSYSKFYIKEIVESVLSMSSTSIQHTS